MMVSHIQCNAGLPLVPVGAALLVLVAQGAPAVGGELDSSRPVSFDRVLITFNSGHKLEGDRIQIVGDSVVVQDLEPLKVRAPIRPRSTESVQPFALSEITRIESGKNQASTGAIVGACAGVGVFVLALATADGGQAPYSTVVLIPFAGLFALAGAGVGAVPGSLFHHWQTVYDAERKWEASTQIKHRADRGGVGYRGVEVPFDE